MIVAYVLWFREMPTISPIPRLLLSWTVTSVTFHYYYYIVFNLIMWPVVYCYTIFCMYTIFVRDTDESSVCVCAAFASKYHLRRGMLSMWLKLIYVYGLRTYDATSFKCAISFSTFSLIFNRLIHDTWRPSTTHLSSVYIQQNHISLSARHIYLICIYIS